MLRYIWMTLAVLGVLAVTGCGTSATSLAEREIIRRAPGFLGPADAYAARVRGLTTTSATEVTVTGTRVRPIPALVLDTLTLDLHGVRYQRDPFLIKGVDTASFQARLTDIALNDYLRTTGRTANELLRNVRVAFLPGEVRVAADMTIAGQTVAVTTAGQFQAAGAAVQYAPTRIVVAGLPVPGTVLPLFALLLRNAVDLQTLKFAPTITSITPETGAITIAGQANAQALTGAAL